MRVIVLIFFVFQSAVLSAQSFRVNGTVENNKTKEPLFGVNVKLRSMTDSSRFYGTVTGFDGNFTIDNVKSDQYKLELSLIGYDKTELPVAVTTKDVVLRVITMSEDAVALKEMKVEGVQVRMEQHGDTTSYNADAFKTNPDATVEDLISKMPGIQVENGEVKAQGESVKKVLIDGQEYFGNDAAAALKNLPAEIVEKIQVFDRMSDQARFTGVNDGEEQKTINIVTKAGKNTGQFGKLYGGYGTNERYSAGGNISWMKGARRLSLIGMSNNINQQNFADEDLLGVLSSGSEGGRGGGRGGRGGGGYGGSQADNFLTGQQNGITRTNSIGVNYNDSWGKKAKFTGSYFFNHTRNENESDLNRQFILADNQGQVYRELDSTIRNNGNHRSNFRLEFDIDSTNSIWVTGRGSLQQNMRDGNSNAFTIDAAESLLNNLANLSNSNAFGWNVSGDAMYRHRFSKKGRTLSFRMNGGYNTRNSLADQFSNRTFYDTVMVVDIINQRTESLSNGYNLGTDITFSEGVGENGILSFTYNPSVNYSFSNKETNGFDSTANDYEVLDTLLSNSFANRTITHRPGASYRWNKGKVFLMFRLNWQYLILESDMSFPRSEEFSQSFQNFLPMASLRYDFSKTRNLRVFYRSATRTPQINQLQNVIDNSNPLQLRSGNPNLDQQVNHFVSLRFNSTNTEKARALMAFLTGEISKDYITNSSLIAIQDTLLTEGVMLMKGAQYTVPVNLNGQWNVRTFVTYALPVKTLKSNFNINGGAGYSATPGRVNGVTNFSNTMNLNGGIVVASNISENLDFNIGWTFNYNSVKNTATAGLNNYLTHQTSARFNWIFKKNFVFNTSFNSIHFDGLEEGFNDHILLWNAHFGYKFAKERRMEARISIFDILGRNTAIARNVTELYIEDMRYLNLTRYLMVSVVWQIRNFGTKPVSSPRS